MPTPLEKAKKAIAAEIHMISGCKDEQTSSDVSNVANFKLPDPKGKAGGALTSALLNVTYADHQDTGRDLSYQDTLLDIRDQLDDMGFKQIPQLSSSRPMNINRTFDLVPDHMTGTRRAVLIGINYVGQKGELRGCHNDVYNMYDYITEVHGFDENDITVLVDDGENISPTKANILAAYQDIVRQSRSGDAVFCHYSGHGGKLKDQDGDEEDGYDESLVPLDYARAGQIRDDDLYDILVTPMKKGVFATFIMDCCHSGSVLDLPFTFAADGSQSEMTLSEDNLVKLSSQPNVPTSIVLLDARSDSLTVSWPPKKGAVWYHLEYKATVDDEFVVLADDLVQPQARKYNMSPDFEYIFRVAAVYEDESMGPWQSHKEPFRPLDWEEEDYCMQPPKVSNKVPESFVLMVGWEQVEDAFEYELQMRPNRGGAEWQDIACTAQVEVKKKNLSHKIGYQFRVRPVTENEEPWSLPSEVVIPKGPVAGPPPLLKGQMRPPWCKNAGMKSAILICWTKFDGAKGYELQWKEANRKKAQWATIAACLKGTEVRKKNCLSKNGYQFRIRPVLGWNNPFSDPSVAAIAS